MNEIMNKEKSYRAMENKLLEKKDRISGTNKLFILNSLKIVDRYMTGLALGNKDDKRLFKQLKLEREYIRAKEKMDLSILIEKKTGEPAGGIYTLAEIGRVLGITRERTRQIEASAMKVLKHPNVGRAIKHYMEDTK